MSLLLSLALASALAPPSAEEAALAAQRDLEIRHARVEQAMTPLIRRLDQALAQPSSTQRSAMDEARRELEIRHADVERAMAPVLEQIEADLRARPQPQPRPVSL